MENTVTYESIRHGDIHAFAQLFEEFYPSMCMVAMKFISDRSMAEDIAQEVFIRLWEKKKDYKEIPCLKTFLYVAVKNRCLNYIRDKKNMVDIMQPEVVNKEEFFMDLILEEETYRVLLHAIEALPPQSSRIMKFVLEGKQNKEIAELLDISVNSVKTLKYNAISALRPLLKDYFYILLLLLNNY